MKARIKHGQTPGEVNKHLKIWMLEKDRTSPRAKSFRKMKLMKERAVLKRRFQAELRRDT